MASTNILFDAASALHAKIVASALNASPEDMAYLATALEKIGGRVSLFEVAQAAAQVQENIQSLTSSASAAGIAAINMTRDSAITEAGVVITQLKATQSSTVNAINTARNDGLDALKKAQLDASVLAATLLSQQNFSRVRSLFYAAR